MTPAEVLWLSGLFAGMVLGLPIGVIVDRIVLRPTVRLVLAVLSTPDDQRGA